MIPEIPPMNNLSWYRTAMRTEMLLTKIKQNSSLLEIVKQKKDITTKLNEDIQNRIYGSINNFVTLLVVGEQGSKKSSVLQGLGETFDPNFKAERVMFEYDEFEKKFEHSKPKEWYILDELIFKHGIGSNRIINAFQTIIETQRKHGASIGVATPEPKLFPQHLFTYTLETFDDCLIATCPYNKKRHEPRTCQCDKENNFKIEEAYVRTIVKQEDIYIGFYIIKINWNNTNWQEYSKAKDEFNKKVRAQQQNRTDYKGMADEIMKDPDSKMYKSKKALKLLVQNKKPNLTTQEQDYVVESISMQRKIDEANSLGDEED